MDPEPKPSAKMDDRLARQLSDATAKNEPLQAWFRLHPEHASQPASAPAAAKALAEKIVGRVSKRVGQSAESVNIQPFLGNLYRQGSSRLPERVAAPAGNCSSPRDRYS